MNLSLSIKAAFFAFALFVLAPFGMAQAASFSPLMSADKVAGQGVNSSLVQEVRWRGRRGYRRGYSHCRTRWVRRCSYRTVRRCVRWRRGYCVRSIRRPVRSCYRVPRRVCYGRW